MWEGFPLGPVVALPFCSVWKPAGTLARLVPSVRRSEQHCACWYSRTETRWGTYCWHSHQLLCDEENWIGQVHVPVWLHLHLQTIPTWNRYFNESWVPYIHVIWRASIFQFSVYDSLTYYSQFVSSQCKATNQNSTQLDLPAIIYVIWPFYVKIKALHCARIHRYITAQHWHL